MACCCSYSRLSLILGNGNFQDGEALLLTPAGFNARGDIAQCIGMEHECRISNNAAHRMGLSVGLDPQQGAGEIGRKVSINTNPYMQKKNKHCITLL